MSWPANSGRGRIANTSRVADPGEAVRCTNGLCEIERIANGKRRSKRVPLRAERSRQTLIRDLKSRLRERPDRFSPENDLATAMRLPPIRRRTRQWKPRVGS